MEVAYTKKAKEDIAFWKNSGNKKILAKISDLIITISQTPFEGIGKPEPLKYNLTDYWSRRINNEHRLVYEVINNYILIHSLKGHY